MATPGGIHLWRTGLLAAVIVAWVGGPAAQAQTVYRCGPAGNEYSQRPCPDGRAVEVSDPRSPAQAAEARAALGAQTRWAAQAARERQRDERANPPPLAGRIGPPKADVARSSKQAEPSPKAGRARTKGSKSSAPTHRDFVAIAPGSGKRQR